MKRAFNFNAGPATLPESVLSKAHQEWFDFMKTGMSVMELSHRSKEYDQVHEDALGLIRRLLSIPEEYEVLFLQGGASLQFSMVPMNLLGKQTGDYILTGSWAEKAFKEATKIGEARVLASSKESHYKSIPAYKFTPSENCAYLHITSNNTIFGTQWHEYPQTENVPLVADMSSDILSRPIEVSQFGLIYAGAQKNLGPSGVTVVIVRKDLLSRSADSLPTMLNYRTYASSNSLYNTPPTLSIYLLKLVLEWAEAEGGIDKLAEINKQKAQLLYDAIDNSGGYYQGHADISSRSEMNVTFTLYSKEMTDLFLKEAKEYGFIGLSGHRSIGGCRASIYNAVPLKHVNELAEFMKSFKEKY